MFKGTDCGGASAPLATSGVLRAKVVGFDAFVPFTVPAAAAGSGYFLRIEAPATGQRNYSELFTVQPLQMQGPTGCVINPLVPAVQPKVKPPGRCNPEYKW